MARKIYDTSVDCYCNSPDNLNKEGVNDCPKRCRCYCHDSVWVRKIAWWLQGTPNTDKAKVGKKDKEKKSKDPIISLFIFSLKLLVIAMCLVLFLIFVTFGIGYLIEVIIMGG